MSDDALRYAGRVGFLLNGLFVEDGIIRSLQMADRFLGDVIFPDDNHDEGVIAAPLVGMALCEFPDEDGGATHIAPVMVVLRSWGFALYDGESPGGNCFLGTTSVWPTDRTDWLARAQGFHGQEDSRAGTTAHDGIHADDADEVPAPRGDHAV